MLRSINFLIHLEIEPKNMSYLQLPIDGINFAIATFNEPNSEKIDLYYQPFIKDHWFQQNEYQSISLFKFMRNLIKFMIS